MKIDLKFAKLKKTVEKLQNTLHTKAKAEPSFRFCSLLYKIYRNDVMDETYGRCRKNRGKACRARSC